MLTHHAYYREGSPLRFGALQVALRESAGFEPDDPNFVARSYEKFGIDEARSLASLASLRPAGGRALFFIAVASITSEAQQALLKLFEEPQEGLMFVLLLPHGMLLPTLSSRMLELPALDNPTSVIGLPYTKEAEDFLASPYDKRSAWVAVFLKEEEGSRERVRGFFGALETLLHPHLGASREVRAGLADIQHFRAYLNDRSPSLKMLLEHLAIVLPTLK